MTEIIRDFTEILKYVSEIPCKICVMAESFLNKLID